MPISSNAFLDALKLRGLDLKRLSERAAVPLVKLEALAVGDDRLSDDEFTALHQALAIPPQALFASAKDELIPTVDFRSTTPRIADQGKGVMQSLAFVEKLSTTLASIDAIPLVDPEIAKASPTVLTKKEAFRLAKHWRSRWGLSVQQQAEWKDANKVYSSLRNFIEDLGVSVLHRSFGDAESSGLYVETNHGFHVIVINTTLSSKARKVFTLAHEFGHVLIGKEGVSNASVIKNNIERFCNWFAARLIAPKSLISYALERYQYTPDTSENFIRLFAEKLGISQEATFLRLVETGYLERADYRAWKRKFTTQFFIPTGDLGERSGGGGGGDPIKNKLTQFGHTLLRSLREAYERGDLDPIDIYRISGLKPKYQTSVFEAA